MGCSESKIDNVRTVNQCKERKAFMKQSVSAHAAFASAHFAYAAALKNTGAALCYYAQSELQSPDDLPPPHPRPPPLENNGILAWDFFVMLMEDVPGPCLAVVDDKRNGIEKPVIQMKVVKNHVSHGGGRVVKTANGGYGGVAESGEGPPPSSMVDDMENVNLLKVFRELDDGFLKASESVCEVSKIHEANNLLHYHSSFADNQGQIKHSTRAMRVINSAKVEFHGTLLDKMLAWEKKLYDEVKSIDSTVSEINRSRDEELYPKLVQIVEQIGEMWKNIGKQHEQQLTIALGLINIKIFQLPKDTSKINLKNIGRIHLQVTNWCSKFEKLMLHQNEYIRSLNNWLKVTLISIDGSVKLQNPKIESLLRTWRDQIEKLPEERAKNAINSFAAVIDEIVQYHSDEMIIKERCDAIRREITRKSREFEEWCDKQISKRLPADEMDVDVMDDMEVIAEQQVVVEVLKRRLAEEEEAYRRQRVQVKDKSLMSLKTALPEIFTAMTTFSGACSNMYERLRPH
ncbi:hypothetical protein L1987_22789 [Smallanthus sonchifolius]|uniref:Uncharacterized protein n=1 Tax=Smallanthus sonchifolius TaxID=185202 RepID=A0ACB9IGE7_9ASTR|nr:hypothetical protein L1987_22789 [Smallanthus sonchifolius]